MLHVRCSSFLQSPSNRFYRNRKITKKPNFCSVFLIPEQLLSVGIGGILIYYLRKLRHRVVEKLFKMLCLIYCSMLLGLSCLLLH